ncbi:hypothetical protein [Azotobacter salinestris]|uniref:hypothetical protein n=1 Tax=Azotobacter salinestris TaxID=69964 RepID=UPI0032DF5D63
MPHETALTQSLVDDALNELENLADDLDRTYPGRGDGLRRAAKLIRRQQAALDKQAAPVATAPPSPAQQPIQLRFPTMLRKMWSGGEVQAWLDERGPFYAAPPAPEPAAGCENYKAALEDIAAVLRQSPDWGADQLNEIVAILDREGVPVSDSSDC